MDRTLWVEMLDWLVQKGFDRDALLVELEEDVHAGGGRRLVASRDLHPREVLMRIPDAALLHRNTLLPLYPPELFESLTAIQLLSLHLCLYRHATLSDKSPQTSAEEPETFIPYLKTLPQDFATLPLCREIARDPIWQRIAEEGLLPEGLKAKTEDVSRRFKKDWVATKAAWNSGSWTLPYLESHAALNEETFAWAWLCVNTRCVYYDLELPDREDNICLAPIIDMANHIPNQLPKAIQEDASLCLYSSYYGSYGSTLAFAAFPDFHAQMAAFPDFASEPASTPPPLPAIFKKGEEVFYEYGAHADDTLLAEYGFLVGWPGSEKGGKLGNPSNNVDVTERVEALFAKLPKEDGDKKREILDSHGYWLEYHLLLQEGTLLDWSYRLTVALALLHLRLDLTSPASEEASLAPWLALVQGEREEVSGQNRSASLRSLREICLGIEEDSREALEKLDQVAATNGDALLDMVKALWKGETTATQQLRQTLDRQLNVRHA